MNAQQLVSDLSLVLTQDAIAAAVGVSQSQVSRWRSGQRTRIDYEQGEALVSLRAQHARAIAKRKRNGAA